MGAAQYIAAGDVLIAQADLIADLAVRVCRRIEYLRGAATRQPFNALAVAIDFNDSIAVVDATGLIRSADNCRNRITGACGA